ncbi:hypothetical protein F8568_037445 [Actinomadura sp. LD22]|uniref:Uncharacterized protein n=1 Tax=Actinomadura physcomitrii TaxID=2650748 RepID=A0A6I4MMQ3_9ACTN|nr:hypothetical protein [Actinomadura physcomitrii]MWA05945.1 hypothetical protein [Actinomadura physcomitrii]
MTTGLPAGSRTKRVIAGTASSVMRPFRRATVARTRSSTFAGLNGQTSSFRSPWAASASATSSGVRNRAAV